MDLKLNNEKYGQDLRWRLRRDCRLIRVRARALCQGHDSQSLKRHRLPLISPNIVKEDDFRVEVKKFNWFGTLRESRTLLQNNLPSIKLIERENELIKFDTERRSHPDTVKYNEFYKYLASAVKYHPPLPPIQ